MGSQRIDFAAEARFRLRDRRCRLWCTCENSRTVYFLSCLSLGLRRPGPIGFLAGKFADADAAWADYYLGQSQEWGKNGRHENSHYRNKPRGHNRRARGGAQCAKLCYCRPHHHNRDHTQWHGGLGGCDSGWAEVDRYREQLCHVAKSVQLHLVQRNRESPYRRRGAKCRRARKHCGNRISMARARHSHRNRDVAGSPRHIHNGSK